MYGLHGEQSVEEIELAHLDGYRGSKPVRIGQIVVCLFVLYPMAVLFVLQAMRRFHSCRWTYMVN